MTTDISTPPPVDNMSLGSHGHKPRERMDIASGKATDPAVLIRVAFGPDGLVVPDFGEKLAGRGAWITPSREAVLNAVKTGAFARAAKAKVSIGPDFADLIETGLRSRVLGLLGMANRAGNLEYGFDKVRSAAGTGGLAFRFEALDGAPDGRGKIRVLARAVAKELEQTEPPGVGCFDGQALGQVLGREHMVHVGVKTGRFTSAFKTELSRLAGFVNLIPQVWIDKEHETPFVPFSKGN